MRRAVLGVLVAAGLVGLFPGSTLAAPTLTLTPKCDLPTNPYSVSIVLSGLAPGGQFEGFFTTGSTSYGPGFLRADQNGEFRIALGDAQPIGTATARGFYDIDEDETRDPGEPAFEASINSPCSEPPVPGGVVTGSGELYFSDALGIPSPVRVTVKALSGPTGQNPTGSVEVTSSTGSTYTGRVSCVSVKNRIATVGVRFNQALPSGLSAGLLDVLDYSFETPVVHDAIWLTRTSTAPAQCPFPVVSRGFREVDTGTFNVGPAPPLLTTKAQCRQGGWQAYGIFANQRECIAYVREQARKACYFELVAHGRPAFRSKYGIGPQRVLAMWSCVHRRTGF